MFPKGSVNGSKYTVINTAMTFYAGQERCQQFGGHLVHVNSLREQLFIEDFLRQILRTTEQQGSVLHLKYFDSVIRMQAYISAKRVVFLPRFVCLLVLCLSNNDR